MTDYSQLNEAQLRYLLDQGLVRTQEQLVAESYGAKWRAHNNAVNEIRKKHPELGDGDTFQRNQTEIRKWAMRKYGIPPHIALNSEVSPEDFSAYVQAYQDDMKREAKERRKSGVRDDGVVRHEDGRIVGELNDFERVKRAENIVDELEFLDRKGIV